MRLFAYLTLLITVVSCNSESNTQPPERQLIWNDEFDYSGRPDTARWSYDTGGHGWGNNELQYYTADRMENARVADGMLTIEAHREPWGGKDYTSARLVTKGKGDWQYGRIEVKAKLPSGLGTWPAIWMLASNTPMKWPDDGEIDIMEHVGYNHGFVHGSIHTKKYNHIIGTQKTDTIQLPDVAENFHVYSMEWNKDSLKVGVDGQDFFRVANDGTGYEAWPFENKMYLLLNVAVGGNWGGQKGVDSTIWPRKMVVDYVRVYK